MERAEAVSLHEIADKILTTRNQKYPPTMKCAGSIFKNYLLAELPGAVAAELPAKVIIEARFRRRGFWSRWARRACGRRY